MQQMQWDSIEDVRLDLNLPDVPGHKWVIYYKEPALANAQDPRGTNKWIAWVGNDRQLLDTLGTKEEHTGWYAATKRGSGLDMTDSDAVGPYATPQEAVDALVTLVLTGSYHA